jgi:hypothetical protein
MVEQARSDDAVGAAEAGFAVHADTAPYLKARKELGVLLGRVDEAVRRHALQLLNGGPDTLLVNLVNVPTGANEITIVAQPSKTLLSLLEALRAGHVNDVIPDRLLIHDLRSLVGVVTPR